MTAPVYNYVRLQPQEIVPDRPFTDVSLGVDDLRAIQSMARRLNELLNGPEDLPDGPRPLSLELNQPSGKYLRFVLCESDRLRQPRDLSAVGFFGQRRFNANRVPINEVDLALQGEFPAFPEVLCYATLQLDDGNFGNLILLDRDGAREHWRESTRHQFAVAELAPNYYATVRLHNGLIRGGLQSEPDVQLVSTKYYDYQEGFWCGLRELQ